MQLPKAGQVVAIPDYIPLAARSPYKGQTEIEVLVSKVHLEHLEKYGPTRKFFDSILIPEILESPTAYFKGLNRMPFQLGFCYSGVPSCRWFDDQTKMPLPPLMVFLVYVVPLGGDHFVLDWNWRFADPTMPGYPKNWRKDYTRQL